MEVMRHKREELAEYQSYDLRIKVGLTRQRIRDWVTTYGAENCCVRMTLSPEGLVLLHMVKAYDPRVPVYFGEEYPFGFGQTAPKALTSWMASEDETGVDDWLRFGCNQYDTKKPESRPMAFWTKEDVYQYLKDQTEER